MEASVIGFIRSSLLRVPWFVFYFLFFYISLCVCVCARFGGGVAGGVPFLIQQSHFSSFYLLLFSASSCVRSKQILVVDAVDLAGVQDATMFVYA
jgi:hypothetical protein